MLALSLLRRIIWNGLELQHCCCYFVIRRKMRQFYCTFLIRDTLCPELSWSHYRVLMRINDEQARRYFMKKAPKEINSVFGYRTSMSMKNKDTWEFAHKYCGKVWYVCGMVLLPITVIFMLLVIGKSEDCVGSMGGIICGVQLIPLIGSILPTEIALKKNFDKNRTRR